ncbi:MAG TPA: RNA 2',3'-cyclic phosphodiesterase [Vicinamibacterales bacterium]|nr:RNA 2',3'-cyclic phosphodiesterase [Vicinamibacterales bacterium]
MRLFFAIALDDAVRAATARVAADLQERLARAGAARAVKWVEPENLHVTLRFIGEVDDGRAARLLDIVAAPLDAGAFGLRVGGAGCFPEHGAPRVLWAGVQEGADRARAVFDTLDRRLAPLRLERELRPYTPHLTLGRVREIERAVGTRLREWLAEAPPDLGALQVDGLTLYRSQLSAKGPRYEALKVIPLHP